MDRQAFKQRMQNLKSYRENNPGKGYWDWKVEAFAEGGQTGDPDKERFYQATGRSSSGRPLEEGLKPVFSLEDAANMTPIGDAISAKDAYDAVKNRDWLSAGLAALTVLPFVPSGLRNVKAAARYIPTVNRTEQSLINQALGNISKKRDYLSDIANSRNRVLEDINTIPYRNRQIKYSVRIIVKLMICLMICISIGTLIYLKFNPKIWQLLEDYRLNHLQKNDLIRPEQEQNLMSLIYG